jgi:hypothetical protein
MTRVGEIEAANAIVTRQRTSPSVSWPSAPPNIHPEAAQAIPRIEEIARAPHLFRPLMSA